MWLQDTHFNKEDIVFTKAKVFGRQLVLDTNFPVYGTFCENSYEARVRVKNCEFTCKQIWVLLADFDKEDYLTDDAVDFFDSMAGIMDNEETEDDFDFSGYDDDIANEISLEDIKERFLTDIINRLDFNQESEDTYAYDCYHIVLSDEYQDCKMVLEFYDYGDIFDMLGGDSYYYKYVFNGVEDYDTFYDYDTAVDYLKEQINDMIESGEVDKMDFSKCYVQCITWWLDDFEEEREIVDTEIVYTASEDDEYEEYT